MGMVIWVITRPSLRSGEAGRPELYVARKYVGDRPGREVCHRDIDRLRELFIHAGFSPLPRHDNDDDSVVERWAP